MTEKFTFKELDLEGESTLMAIANAGKFNKWMYNTIKPYCKGEVLEIGSGIGNISHFFLMDNFSITLSDIRTNYCEVLKENYSSKSNLKDVILMDLVDTSFDEKFNPYFNSFDTIFALNVVEHIHDDKLAIKNCRKLLKKGGHLIILVPAFQSLYNSFDKALEHYRRYNKKSLREIFEATDFTVIKSFYFNAVGTFGWFISGKLQKNEIIPKGQMSLYDKFVPIFKVVDKVCNPIFGLSVVTIGVK